MKLILTWSEYCNISEDNGVTTFALTNTKRYVLRVTISTRDIKKVLQRLKLGFECLIYWNK